MEVSKIIRNYLYLNHEEGILDIICFNESFRLPCKQGEVQTNLSYLKSSLAVLNNFKA